MDLDPARPSVLDIMEDYWRLLPAYQGVDLADLSPTRVLSGRFSSYLRAPPHISAYLPPQVLFGFFSSYKDSPLPVKFDRVMQIGDAGGLQSPLSFGGFGAITRHIGRLTSSVEAALQADALAREQLALINPYQASSLQSPSNLPPISL